MKAGGAFPARGPDVRRVALTVLGLTAVLFYSAGCAMAANTNGLSEAQIQGRQLARELLEQWPATNFTQTGVLKIRDGDGHRSEVPVKFEIFVTAANWLSVYDASRGATNRTILKIVHRDATPNDYQLAETNNPDGIPARFAALNGEQTMIPFAGSDFWVADLGLEFLHWPEQKLLKREFKRGCGCRVLESINPHPSPNGYSRVVAWIDNETGGIVQAEGYDARGKLLKEFFPKSFKKVNGQWELQEMEIRNKPAGSRTRLEFDLSKE